jgi:DNA-binding SARP family transcriptional activator/WD40 repeat protein
VLVARANTVVGQDALIDAVWAGEPPESARQTLHTYVSTLRKALGGQIERDGDGYLLQIERSNLDSFRFEDLVDSARPLVDSAPAEAIAMLQEALGIWRGRAFGDLDGEPALANEAIRLEEARLSALELRIRADLVLGNHAAVVQELEALTREHPFRERLRADLMLALYRSGRQADALRVYRQTRSFLAEELGIDPTQELQELEEQILNHDHELDWKSVTDESSRGGRAARGYELREELGPSSFGTVYRGFQNSVGREVTVLAIDPGAASSPRFVRRFESEMQAASRLEHPHIAPIYDFWRDPEGAFIVIPFLAGGSLRRSLESGPWNLSSTMRLIDQVSSALTYAHRNGVVHSALGLDNIILDEGSNAYLCEFGLIELAGLDAAGDRGVARDVHDLALVSFAALTATTSPPTGRIGETRPDLIVLDHVFRRALHADPGSRYQKPEDFRRALRQVAGADVITPSPDVRAEVERRNPFKGLRAFHESDAADFYGRDALIEELVETVAGVSMVTVVGPSGSGKSSLVRAGLIPALREGAIPGSSTWLITEMFPGTHPFEELEAALIRVAVDRPPGFFEDLTADERGLARVAKQILTGEDDELLLVIDQFEELFSLVSSESVRSQFLETLVAAATDGRSRIRMLLTLRADFFDQPLRYSEFAEVMRRSVLPLGPPTDDGLARAIARPARDVGLDLEPGLVTRIVDDVKDEPGGLPLMQYALTELFAARQHDTLTLDGYHRTGGVIGALGRRAEEIYQHLSDDGKEATRHLFLRLVSVDELADDTRRRVRQTELRALGINPMVLDDVLQQFGAYRLLSFDRDAATRTPTIEVAHEALIREWDRLRTWVDERREDLLIHRRIQVAVRDWEDSGEDPSFLLRGSRLEQALLWQERTDLAISDDEMTFIEASIETERREVAERQALEEKAARRRKAVIGSLTGGLVVAGVLGVIALDRAQEARLAATEAYAQELSATAMLAVEEDAELGVLLALEAIESAVELGLDPVPEAISALRSTVPQLRVTDRLEEGDYALALSPDGSTIAGDRYIEDDDVSAIALMDAATGDVTYMIDPPVGSTGFIRDLAFSPQGDLLASTRASALFYSPQAVSAVDLYHVATRRYLMTLAPDSEASLGQVSFGSGGLLAANGGDGSTSGSVHVWNTADGGEVFGRSSPRVRTGEFVPGTVLLLIGEAPGAVEAVDVRDDEVLWSFETTIEPQQLAVSPDGSLLAISDPYASRSVQVLSLPDGHVLFTTSHQDPQGLTWSPDSAVLAVTGNDGDITLLEVATGSPPLVLSGHQASVTSVAFLQDSRHVATASLDGQPRVWSIASEGSVVGRALRFAGSPVAHTMSPDGGLLFVLMHDTGSMVVDLSTGAVGPTFPVGYRNPHGGVVDASFTRLAGTDDGYEGQLFDLVSGERILTFDPPCLSPRALSPDASLVLVDRFELCSDEPGPNGVIETESGELVLDLGRREVLQGVFGASDEGRRFVVVNFFETIETYWLDSGEVLGTLAAQDVGDPFLVTSLSSDGRYLGIGTNGPRAVVVDMERVLTGTPMAEALLLNVEAHKGNTPFVSVTPEGVAISAGFDGFYRAWDVGTAQKLWEIQVVGLDDFPSISFNTDETELIYEDADGVLRFTPVDTERIVAQARAALTRDLTDDECRQYLHTDGCEPES